MDIYSLHRRRTLETTLHHDDPKGFGDGHQDGRIKTDHVTAHGVPDTALSTYQPGSVSRKVGVCF